MKQLHNILASVALLLLCGCVTQYSKVGFAGGYSEARKSRNEFAVSFSGNGYTTGQRAVDLCLLRCAELTLGHGFRYFIVTANKTEFDKSTAITTGNFIPTGYGGGVFLSTTQTIPKPGVANTILCFREEPASVSEHFDAQKVFDELSRKYGVKREVQKFPAFRLHKAAVGVDLEPITPRTNPNFADTSGASADEKPRFKVRGFSEGSHAQDAGIQIGDAVVAFDDVPFTSFDKLAGQMAGWEIGQTIEVTVRRANKELRIPVRTAFNLTLRFKSLSDIKCSDLVSEKDVTVFEGSLGQIVAFPIDEFGDWENPVATAEEFKTYAVAAAANKGANGVHLLSSGQQVKSFNPNANNRLGFLCALLVMPKARLGVEFERGAGYENRRVIRRIQNKEAESAGLRIGDNILATNGIDVLQSAELAVKDQMKWEVGQVVEVTVARDGREVKIPIRTIPNR